MLISLAGREPETGQKDGRVERVGSTAARGVAENGGDGQQERGPFG